MKKVRFFEYLTLFFIILTISLLGYGYVYGATTSLITGTTTTGTTTITPCTPIGIYTPTEGATVSGPMGVKVCQPGATGAIYRLVYLYTTTTATAPLFDSQVQGLYPTVNTNGAVVFPAFDTSKAPNGPYQLHIQMFPAGNIYFRNIWIKNNIVTTTPTSTVTAPTTSTTTVVPPTVSTDITNLPTGTKSTEAIQDYVNTQIATEEAKKLPPELKSAPLSIVLSADSAKVTMTSEKKGKVVLSGKAEPNTTIYLYIFSDPVVVSVKTDANGNWNYSLDTELNEGKHDVYVAVKNDDGTIKAKSLPYSFFVGQAIAASGGETASVVQKPNYTLYYVIFAVSAVLLVISAIFFLVAKSHVRKNEKLAQN